MNDKFREFKDTVKFIINNLNYLSYSELLELSSFNRYYCDRIINNKFEKNFKIT